MRFRLAVALLLCLLCAFGAAQAQTVLYGDTLYVFSAETDVQPTLTLTLRGERVNADTFETETDASLAGAVFGVYAVNGAGEYVPWPDASDPSRPLTFTTGEQPSRVQLPLSVELYLKQLSAPEGYRALEEYISLSLPGEITLTNRAEGMSGVRVELTGDSEQGPVPLVGVTFHLEGEGKTHALTTDEQGVASALGIAPGVYRLCQQGAPQGYSIDDSSIEVIVTDGEAVRVAVRNSLPGFLQVRPFGVAPDANRTPRLVAIDRAYDVFDVTGTRVAQVGAGQTVALPASQAGTRYTLRAQAGGEDGFAPDEQAYEVLLFSNRTAQCETVSESRMGYFTLTCRSAQDGAPVAGAVYALVNAQGETVRTLTTGADGLYDAREPVPAGAYTLRLLEAADGYLYDGGEAALAVPVYMQTNQIAQVETAMQPVPVSLLHPTVTAQAQSLPSLLDAGADITAALSLADMPLPVENLTFAYAVPDETGAAGDEVRETGGEVSLALSRRYAVPDAPAPDALVLEGRVRYAFTYPTDAQGGTRTVSVDEPFAVEIARFRPSELDKPERWGYVTDANGQPVAGAQVSLADGAGKVLETVLTDPFGAYAFAQSPQGAKVAFALPEAMRGEALGFAVDGENAQILPLETVRGRVVAHGTPEGMAVTLSLGDLTTAPDAQGQFVFSGVRLDGLTVAVNAPEGVLSRVETENGETVVHLCAAASVRGVAKDPNGQPVAGVRAFISGVGETRTDAAGAYTFDGLFPGAYTLRLTAPEGYVLNDAPIRALSLDAGEAAVADIGVMQPASLEGVLTEGGAPCSAIEITLQPTGDVAQTDAQGRFAFENLPAGEYTLDIALPENAVLLTPVAPVALTVPAQRETLALEMARPVRVAGRVWYDEDDDGYLTAGEGELSGVRVALLKADGNAVAEVITGSDGAFAFEGLTPDAYQLDVTLPENTLFARSAPDVERMIADVDSRRAQSERFVLASGEAKEDILLGAVRAGTVSGRVWNDADGDGLAGDAEGGLSGARVALLRGEETLREIVTGEDGRYTFDLLRMGDYDVRVTLPDGYLFTRQLTGVRGETSAFPAQADAVGTRNVSLRRWKADAAVSAGAVQSASACVSVWLDANANGLLDAGETPMEAMEIVLCDVSGARAVPVYTAHTDARGEARFDAVRPGAYALRYRLPEGKHGLTTGEMTGTDGWGQSEAFTLLPGGQWTAQTGVTALGAIGGQVFLDADYDGLRGEAEGGLRGVTVTLLGADGQPVRSAQTDGAGAYAFENLTAGSYALDFALPDGYFFTRARDDAQGIVSDVPETTGTRAQSAPVALAMGNRLTLNAGVYETVTVSGVVWHDEKNSGRFDASAPGIARLDVTLLQDGKAVAQARTDEEGAYAFANLAPGRYALAVALPEGMAFSRAGGDSAIAGHDAQTSERNLPMGARETLRVGAVYTAALEGRVLHEGSGQGVADAQVTVRRGGETLAQARTGADGRYRFENLLPGDAEIAFELPDGWIFAEGSEASHAVALAQGASAQDTGARLLRAACLTGGVWLDADADGLWSEGEKGLAGVTVSLRRGEMEIASAATDADGAFRFDGLMPGDYTLSLAQPKGTLLYGQVDITLAALTEGETRDTLLYPAFEPATLRGTVWEDSDNNGLKDRAEPRLEGVEVTLLDEAGRERGKTATDADGAYRFESLPPGNYRLRFALPEDCVFANRVEGGSIVTPVEGYVGESDGFALAMGEQKRGMDAGTLRAARIGDLVWVDENLNGLMDTSEPGLAGVKVTLWRMVGAGSERVVDAVTDAHGRYRFSGVRPGEYRISFTPPSGYLPTRVVSGLDELSSKLPWFADETLYTRPFDVRSGESLMNRDAGLVTQESAEAAGWSVGADGEIKD